jgi:hypothetical protein
MLNVLCSFARRIQYKYLIEMELSHMFLAVEVNLTHSRGRFHGEFVSIFGFDTVDTTILSLAALASEPWRTIPPLLLEPYVSKSAVLSTRYLDRS